MSDKWNWRVVAAIISGVVGCGSVLWPIPYDEVAMLENPGVGLWLLAGGVAGAFSAVMLSRSVWRPVACVMTGFSLAVIGRIGVEVMHDPTLHNLWPLEVVIAAGFGLVSGLLGVLTVRIGERVARGAQS